MSHVFTSFDPGSPGSALTAHHMVIREQRASVARPLPRCSARALALWPRLDRARLLQTKGDPTRIAALVTRRTAYSSAHVIAMLTKDPESWR